MDAGCLTCRTGGIHPSRHSGFFSQKPTLASGISSRLRRCHSFSADTSERPLPPLSTIPKPGAKPLAPGAPRPPAPTKPPAPGGNGGSQGGYNNNNYSNRNSGAPNSGRWNSNNGGGGGGGGGGSSYGGRQEQRYNRSSNPNSPQSSRPQQYNNNQQYRQNGPPPPAQPSAPPSEPNTASPNPPATQSEGNSQSPAAGPNSPSLLQKPSLHRPEGLLQKPTLKRPEPPVRPPPPAQRNNNRNNYNNNGNYNNNNNNNYNNNRYQQRQPGPPGQQRNGGFRPGYQGRGGFTPRPQGPPSATANLNLDVRGPQTWQQRQQQGQQQQQQQGQQGQQGQAQDGPRKLDFVVVEEAGEEEDDDKKGKGKGKGRGKGKEMGRVKVTAAMKREARKMRKADREAKRVVSDKEEIFEVGEEGLSVMELSDMLQINLSDVIMALFMKGIVCTANQQLDRNTVKLVAKDYDVLVLDKEDAKVTDMAKKRDMVLDDEDLDNLEPRPPVVTVMGHVDHGKTSLLDFIRKSRVAAGEAGGITQQIGAYTTEVEVEGEMKTICFLDTPGHEAFSAMRARGASVTDIAIIIVAADDGVQPQTKEAISHAQAAGVPILVAINKVDKAGADPEKTKSELTECSLVPEEWGGSTPMVPISAKTGEGMEELMLNIVLMAEERGLLANPNRPAAGTVIEAHLDRKSGPVTNVLVQTGTLKLGDVVRAGASYGKVKSLSNDLGKNLPYASPSVAVQILGLNSVPQAGDEFEVVASEAEARKLAEEYGERMRELRLAEMSAGGSMVTLSSLATIDEDMEVMQKLNLVVKGDTQGVVEAIKVALNQLPQDSVMLRFLWAAAGEITQADVDLAAASNGLLLAFNLQPSEQVQAAAKRLGVEVRSYKVIYNLIDDVRAAMEGKLATVEERTEIGKAEVKAVFGSGNKKVAGCAVLEGRLRKGCLVVVTRKKKVVWEGPLSSLRRVKDIVDEIPAGQECGVASEGFLDWKEGDLITAVESVQKSRTLEEAKAKSVSLDSDDGEGGEGSE